MTETTAAAPPRPIAPGDVVVAYSELLGEWTAAQITDLHAGEATAGILELDWSGPEPESVDDLGDVQPLRLTHHSWGGALSYGNRKWVLPRSHKVIGTLPLLHDQPSNAYGGAWGLGFQLFLQRRWDRGERDQWSDPRALECSADELEVLLQASDGPDREIRRLTVRGVGELDVERLVARFPMVTDLWLSGAPGTLAQASRFNELTSLKSLSLYDLFGMEASDCLLPSRTPALESLDLNSVPADYAAAMHAAWQPEAPLGVHLVVEKPREAGWLAENRDNPFRVWDGDDYVPRSAFEAAVAQYKETRGAVMAVLAAAPTDDQAARLFEIGERYGEAFNDLDEQHQFIDTIERERLFDVLDHIVDGAEAAFEKELAWARESLVEGVESVRDW